MTKNRKNVYLGWLAYNNDPYAWVRDRNLWGEDEQRFVRTEKGDCKMGPTLSLLTESRFAGKVDEARFLTQGDTHSETILRLLERELNERQKNAPTIETLDNDVKSIIDHREMLDIMQKCIRDVTDHYSDEQVRFLVNISPGPPAAQAIWMLLTQAGEGLFSPHEVEVFQGIPKKYRQNGDVLQSIDLQLPTLWHLARLPYEKAHRRSFPSGRATQDPPEDMRSKAVTNERDKSRKVAELDFPVLLLGERGVGKTTWAKRFIHAWSKRNEESFEEVVCGAHINPKLLKGELFGWKKGSWSGAEHEYKGALKRADGGTLFLDEIGDMSQELQRTIIRAVDDGGFAPLGAAQRENSDFRLVCATNLELQELENLLDADFRDRIFRVIIKIPSLRQRKEDLPHIWLKVYETIEKKYRLLTNIADDVHDKITYRLQQMRLPGNFRTLERLAMLIIMESYDPVKQICSIDWCAAERQLDKLTREEKRDDDPLRQCVYDFVKHWYEQGPTRWEKIDGLFGKDCRLLAMNFLEDLWKRKTGDSPQKKEIETVLGFSKYIQKKLRGLQ